MNALTGTQIDLTEMALRTIEDRVSDAERRRQVKTARTARRQARREARREARRTRPTASAPALPAAAHRFLPVGH
jgi:hypothetical protein